MACDGLRWPGISWNRIQWQICQAELLLNEHPYVTKDSEQSLERSRNSPTFTCKCRGGKPFQGCFRWRGRGLGFECHRTQICVQSKEPLDLGKLGPLLGFLPFSVCSLSLILSYCLSSTRICHIYNYLHYTLIYIV